MASSLEGATINACISSLLGSNLASKGSRKPSVLPVPVGESNTVFELEEIAK